MRMRMRMRMMIGLFIGVGIFGGCLEDERFDATLGKESMDFKRFIGSNNHVPLMIRSIADLEAVRNNLEGHYILDRGLDLRSIENFKPIGDEKAPFKGMFDGKGKVIKNLTINRKKEHYVGLFGVIEGGNAVVKNVILKNVNISSHKEVGSLVGVNYDGMIENSDVEGNVRGNYSIGGLVGENSGTIKNSKFKGNVTGEELITGGLVGENFGAIESGEFEGYVKGKEIVGGLVGSYYGGSGVRDSYIKDSHVKGGSEVKGDSHVGGLVGQYSGGNIRDSYSKAYVEGETFIGGLVGASHGRIWNSYATGKVKGKNIVGGFAGVSGKPKRLDFAGLNIKGSYATGGVEGVRIVGGFVGLNFRTVIEESYATGDVEGIGNDHWIGGLVGWNYGRIEGSYATGGVKSRVNIAGGLVGLNVDMIKRSYATGIVEGGNNVGGLVGWNGKAELDSLKGTMGRRLLFLDKVLKIKGTTLILGDTGGTIENSYATGKVEGKQMIGGLVGYFNKGKIQKSYATGKVEGNGNVGGFVGWRFKGRIYGRNYWKAGSATQGVGRGSGENVEVKTDAELKLLDATETGWDTAIWDFQAGEYPKSRWQR